MKKILLVVLVFILSVGFSYASITLPKNMVNGKNILTSRMFKYEKTTYIIQYNYDLCGQQVKLPKGSTLHFKKGSFCNGELVGNDTKIFVNSTPIFRNINIKGDWGVEKIYSKWFFFGEDGLENRKNLQNMCNLTSDNHKGEIWMTEMDCKVDVPDNNTDVISLNSNTTFHLVGSLVELPNSFVRYTIIAIHGKENIVIDGGGSITGDVVNHKGDEGEWGMGIKLYAGKNVTIQNILIQKCWGDCICLAPLTLGGGTYPESINIKNVTCKAGRRQGLSVIAGKDILITKSNFYDIGSIKFTSPGAGIDIEPDRRNTKISNVIIDRCSFRGMKDFSSDLMTYGLPEDASVFVRNCVFENAVRVYENSQNVVFESCDMPKFVIMSDDIFNISVRNCKVGNIDKGKGVSNKALKFVKYIKESTTLGK